MKFFNFTRTHNTFCIETGACMADFVVERRNVDFHVVAETFTKYELKVVLFKPDRIILVGIMNCASLCDKVLYV